MKVVILAGGLGTRLAEETGVRPKPMVEIGDKPILWHIIKIYSTFGFKDFIICGGYKSDYIKNWIDNLTEEEKQGFNSIELVDTGDNSMTGGRVKRIQNYINNEPFMLTYGDGVADININTLVSSHKQSGKKLTVTGVQPTGRFGGLKINHDTNLVEEFNEKPKGDGIWINGGFFVCEPDIFNYIDSDKTIFEQEPINQLVDEGELNCYKHHGFWKCMDTLKDKNDLNKMWNENKAEWKLW
jgi:glucose-1-phosphate cytidylyltransferase